MTEFNELLQDPQIQTIETKILIVDDDPLTLDLLERILQSEGHQVLKENNGKAALEVLQKTEIALIISDHFMPEMTGIELLTEAQILQPDSMRILLTGHSSSELTIDAINISQVHYYITKPWDEEYLKKIVKSSLEQYRLVKENKNLQSLIVKQHKKLVENHRMLVHELDLGARIQEELLVGRIPSEIEGFDIAAISKPSKDIDGDFFDFFLPSKEIFDVVIGDVMGKGIAAALVGSTVKTQLLRFSMAFTLPKVCEGRTPWIDDLLSPTEILQEVHEAVSKNLMDLEFFVTLFYARFNQNKHTLTYLDCGSTKPIHYHADTRQSECLMGENLPLGVVEKFKYVSQETRYREGDVFVFYSDGVTEAKNQEKQLFGVKRLRAIIDKNAPNMDSDQLLDQIKKEVLEFSKKEQLDDDLTLVVVGVTNHPLRTEEVNIAKFHSELSQLDAVRNFVRRLVHDVPGDRHRLIARLELAINEAFCNIVLHGYKEDSRGEIVITGELDQAGVAIEISDQGESVDPSRIPEPDLAGGRYRGFGWYLIREIADQVQYNAKRSESGWNHLRLYKKFILEENEMQVTHKKQNEVLIITPEGANLDARDAPEFKKEVIDLINKNSARKVIIDLHKLQFIDSSGLGSFLSVLKTLNSQGGDLKLSCMNNPIRTMFELVAMHKIFDIFNTNEDAIRSFG